MPALHVCGIALMLPRALCRALRSHLPFLAILRLRSAQLCQKESIKLRKGASGLPLCSERATCKHLSSSFDSSICRKEHEGHESAGYGCSSSDVDGVQVLAKAFDKEHFVRESVRQSSVELLSVQV